MKMFIITMPIGQSYRTMALNYQDFVINTQVLTITDCHSMCYDSGPLWRLNSSIGPEMWKEASVVAAMPYNQPEAKALMLLVEPTSCFVAASWAWLAGQEM